MDLGTTAAFLASAIACTLLAFGLRAFFWKQMRALGNANTVHLPAVIDEPLRPAELAYLAHDGDMGHTMVVLVVDLIQRVIKSRGEEELILQPYEKVIIANVKEFVKKWATDKVGEFVPPKHELRNPMQWLIRIRAIKTFFGGTLRQFVRDFVKDPLHIRKYFSWSGIARFTVTSLRAWTSRTTPRWSVKLRSLSSVLRYRNWVTMFNFSRKGTLSSSGVFQMMIPS